MSIAPHRGLRMWRPESGFEPTVRIGVALPDDAMQEIELAVPDTSYRLAGEGFDLRDVRCGSIRARSANGRLELSINRQPLGSTARCILSPIGPVPLARRQGVLAKGLIVGRGFHWQKRVDQTLPGCLEIVPGKGGLVLVNELPLETYLAGVITSEMGSGCPAEFLRAQCVTARSWLLAFTEPKHDTEPFDRCNDDCCQRYQGSDDLTDGAIDAAQSTRGMVLMAEGAVVDANYSKSCGGIVELPEHVWGIRKPGLGPVVDAPPGSAARRFLPVTEDNLSDYLAGEWLRQTDVYCSPRIVPEEEFGQYLGRVDDRGQYFRWEFRYTHDELVDLLRKKAAEFANLSELRELRVTQRGISGRATEIAIDYTSTEGQPRTEKVADQYRIRQILHPSFLYSSAFAVELRRDAAGRCREVTLHGAGWGHGAGLCQIGALGMALCGVDHARILKHYFPGAELKQLYA